MKIALVPLDERPVNTGLPRAVGAVAGVEVVLPDAGLLPVQRDAGDVAGLATWLEGVAPDADAVCVCLDTLLYGGLVAARTTDDATAAVLTRLATLERVREAAPGVPVDAVSLVMRASNSYSDGEEPLYWSQYGKELHALGGALQHLFEEPTVAYDDAVASLERAVPADVRADFERRRLRNHQVNLSCLDLLSRGVVDTLFVTADDTAPYAAGTLEQRWLAHWARALPLAGTFLMHPGADEVGAILVARALVRSSGRPVRVRIAASRVEELGVVPAYENVPLVQSAQRQVLAAGCDVVEEGEDLVIVLHPAHPGRLSWSLGAGDVDPDVETDVAARTAALVRALLAEGKTVALADVRYTNGSDPRLVDDLAGDGSFLQLAAYGGWNTAGNTLGSVVALAVAQIVGRRAGTVDDDERLRQLLHRAVEDRGYQAGARDQVRLAAGLPDHGTLYRDDDEAAAEEQAAKLLGDYLAALDPEGRFTLTGVRYPWHRTFEIDFELRATAGAAR